MKRPFSLLEICIGLALTMILMTSLFSSFRFLMKKGAEMKEIRHSLHPYHVLHMRLNQIFSSLNEGNLFYTDTHEKGQGLALYFICPKNIDPDPQFCGEVEGVFYWNKENALVLELKNTRIETYLTNVRSFSMEFFDPKETTWIEHWNKDTLPPLIKIRVSKKEYTFFLSKTSQMVNDL